MSAHLYNYKISYFSVPKCACTTLKRFFFEVQNGFPFQNFIIDNQTYHVHRFYISRHYVESAEKTPSDHSKYAVIRDPVSRMVSCFRNRVDNDVGRNLMREKAAQITAHGLPIHPTWQEFLDNLDAYRKLVPMLKHHSEPLSYFLGQDPKYFDRIFPISKIDSLVDEIEKKVGNVPTIGHSQTRGTDFKASMVSEVERKKIHALFAEDLEIFGGYL